MLSDQDFEAAQRRAAERLEEDARRMAEASRPQELLPSPRVKLAVCADCDGAVSRFAVSCPHCGRPFAKGRQPVEVMNVKMEFEAMVWFMVKAALASIPAAIILFILFYVLIRLIGWRAF